MKTSSSLLFFIAFLLSACADRNYVQDPALPGTNLEKTSLNCEFQFPAQKICLNFTWENFPTEGVPGVLRLRMFRGDETDNFPFLTDPETTALKVSLWMPAMGHGSAPTRNEKLDIGTYRVSNMFFIMPGEWEIVFQLLNENEVIDEVAVPFIL